MDEQTIRQRISTQRDFFATGATLPLSFRLKQLEQLKLALKRHEQDLYTALKADLGKSRMESYMCEIGLTLSELTWMQKHLPKLMRCKTVPTPLAHFAAKSFQSPFPYGTVLIMSPWNYPVLLTLEPLIDALAAGNTVILKPSAYAPHTSQILSQLLKECYPPEYVTMITGGREENQALLNQRFDKIFFIFRCDCERSPSSCCRIPDSRHSGAWWEKPVHRGFHGENFSHRKTDHIRKIPQLRTDLRCPGLYPLRYFCSKPAASGTGKRNPPAVWQTASSKSGLWENHQRKTFSPAAEPDCCRQAGLWR